MFRGWVTSVGPWGRFGLFAVVALGIGSLLPSTRLPGPSPTTAAVPSTGVASPPAAASGAPSLLPVDTFAFDTAEFVERWNAVTLDPALRPSLELDSLLPSAEGRATARILIPESDVDWTIGAEIDPTSRRVRVVYLRTPLAESDAATDAQQVGMLMFIAAVENDTVLERAIPIYEQLLTLAVATPDLEFAVERSTPNATYVLSLSAAEGFQLAARP